MYSFSYLEPVCCSMSSSNCCFLICIQVSQEAGQVVWYSHLFQNFPQFIVIHTIKGFGTVNKAEIYVFLELSCFFHDPVDVGNWISGSSAFSKTSLNIREFTVHVFLKPGLEYFEHYFTSMWDECREAWHAVIHGVTKSRSRLSDWTELNWTELFQILKDDAVKVLHSICQQIWKTQQWPQDWKRSVFIPIPKKGKRTLQLQHNNTHLTG